VIAAIYRAPRDWRFEVEHHREARPSFAARLGFLKWSGPMDLSFVDRIDAAGNALPLVESELGPALLEGETLHRDFRPDLKRDYVSHLRQMADEGAGVIQLVDQDEVRAIAVWRTFLTTYCGRRFEIDDLVTAEGQRSKGYGATLIEALETKARALSCDTVMLASATWRTDAHRFYFRQRYAIRSFLFSKKFD
jgi:GNAT superfamily N-acetyltransferase